MKSSPKHPAVYIPPPVIGILIFLLSIGIQKGLPVGHRLFHSAILTITGWLFIIIALFFGGKNIICGMLSESNISFICNRCGDG